MSQPEDVDRRLTAVEQGLAELRQVTAQSSVDASAARTLAAGADRDVSEVRAELRAHLSVLNALRETQVEHGRRLDRIDGRLERIDGRLDQVDSRFAQVDERFAQVDSRFDQVDSRFDQVDSRFDQVDSRFDQVDERFGEVAAAFTQVDANFASVERQFGTVHAGLAQIVTLIERLDR